MATTKVKLRVNTQKTMIKDSSHTTTKSHQITKEGRRESKKQSVYKQKTMSYMALISPYLFTITTLNINRFFSQIKRH